MITTPDSHSELHAQYSSSIRVTERTGLNFNCYYWNVIYPSHILKCVKYVVGYAKSQRACRARFLRDVHVYTLKYCQWPSVSTINSVVLCYRHPVVFPLPPRSSAMDADQQSGPGTCTAQPAQINASRKRRTRFIYLFINQCTYKIKNTLRATLKYMQLLDC